jgi:alkylhydroperoxidase family enzyme
MPHIELPPLPGIAGLLAGFPETAGPLNTLAEALLRGPSQLNGNEPAESGPLMEALLAVADRVRIGGHEVTAQDIERARAAGADDRMIHDTVLIAAAFSMFNRYVDGLDALTPEEPALYERHAGFLAAHGYLQAPG